MEDLGSPATPTKAGFPGGFGGDCMPFASSPAAMGSSVVTLTFRPFGSNIVQVLSSGSLGYLNRGPHFDEVVRVLKDEKAYRPSSSFVTDHKLEHDAMRNKVLAAGASTDHPVIYLDIKTEGGARRSAAGGSPVADPNFTVSQRQVVDFINAIFFEPASSDKRSVCYGSPAYFQQLGDKLTNDAFSKLRIDRDGALGKPGYLIVGYKPEEIVQLLQSFVEALPGCPLSRAKIKVEAGIMTPLIIADNSMFSTLMGQASMSHESTSTGIRIRNWLHQENSRSLPAVSNDFLVGLQLGLNFSDGPVPQPPAQTETQNDISEAAARAPAHAETQNDISEAAARAAAKEVKKAKKEAKKAKEEAEAAAEAKNAKKAKKEAKKAKKEAEAAAEAAAERQSEDGKSEEGSVRPHKKRKKA